MAKQQQQEPNYPMTMRKREISPEESTGRTSHLQDSKTLATLSTRQGRRNWGGGAGGAAAAVAIYQEGQGRCPFNLKDCLDEIANCQKC